MAFLNGERFPYTNTHDLNLDWIIKKILELNDKVDNLNSIISVADPPEWDITTQYAENCIVFYDDTGYISIQPVPAGIELSNTDYWVPIIDVSNFEIADPFTWNSTMEYGKNVIVKYNNTIYKSNIIVPAGTVPTNTTYWEELTYVSPYNICNPVNWSASTQYYTNDIVKYGNGLYLALQNSIGNLPTNTAYFREIYNVVIPENHRIVGKQIAVYGDSWSTEQYGAPWLSVLSEVSGLTVHVQAQGSLPLSGVYNLFDNYNADIYIIEAGLNDCSLSTKGDEFGNALTGFISAIRGVNPNAEIYFMTPTNIQSTAQLRYLFPIEFYRSYVWHMAGLLRFNVINGLKITDIAYSDGVHPTSATAHRIANHIISAIDTFGDEETHITEITTLGRSDNQLIFTVRDGLCYLRFQNFRTTTSAGTGAWAGMYTASIELSESMGMSCYATYSCLGFPNNNAGQLAHLFAFAPYNTTGIWVAFTANVSTILAPAELNIMPSAWQRVAS